MQEYYWSLILEPNFVQAALWTIEEKRAKVVATSKPLAWSEEADLVEAANAVLSSIVHELVDFSEEPTKTVFGVPPSWVSDGQINKEQLGAIRAICSKLSLTPSGFVVLPEAIAHSVKLEEGSPLSGVIIGVGKHLLDVTLFKLGNLVGTVSVGRSVSLVEDVVEGLSRFATGDPFPSRFIVYGGKDPELDEARDLLVAGEWSGDSEKVSFLHTPQIETIDSEKKAVAVSVAGASELGEIIGVVLEEQKYEDSEAIDSSGESDMDNITSADELGAADVGFVLGEDITETDDVATPFAQTAIHAHPPVHQHIATSANHLKKIRLPKIFSKLPHFKIPRFSVPGTGNPAVMLALFFLFLGGLFAAWWFIPTAQITIYVSPQKLQENVSLKVDLNADSLDVGESTIPADNVETTVSGSKKGNATGSKRVGDKAKGKVTVRNGTASGIKLPSGTILFASNDLKFVLTDSASVSAAQSPSSPGSVTVDVAAEGIGSEYNLAKSETFVVANYPKSEVDAVVETELTGGSSRDIVAVSADDLKKIEKELLAELEEQVVVKLMGEISSDKIFIKEALSTSATKKQFSHKAGDEASDVTLQLDIEATGVVVSKADVEKIALEALQSKVPSGFVLRASQIQPKFLDLEEEGDNIWTFNTAMVANLLPELNPDDIAKKLKGKSKAQAERYLESIAGYSRVDIVVKPKLPGVFGTIPRVLNHISVEISGDL